LWTDVVVVPFEQQDELKLVKANAHYVMVHISTDNNNNNTSSTYTHIVVVVAVVVVVDLCGSCIV